MKSDDDDDEAVGSENSLRKKLLILLVLSPCIAVVIAAVPVGVYFIANLLHLGGNVTDDIVFSGFGPPPKPEPIINIVFTTRLNYTDAGALCAHMFREGRLAFPQSVVQEESLMTQFIQDYKKQESVIQNPTTPCGSEFYIGLRKSLDYEWQTADGSLYVLGPAFYPAIYSKEFFRSSNQCINLAYRDNFLLQNADCNDDGVWNCFVCEYKCPTANLCYELYQTNKVHNYDEALSYCNTQLSGSLVSVPHLNVLKEVKNQIKSRVGICQTMAIGHRAQNKYESMNEELLSYQTERIAKPGTMSENCLTINVDNDFFWEAKDCSALHCFVCEN